ncbi:hypothetical protein [Mesorhizobium sp. SEMIA 3007]|uniref:hypothetical protein n=1 Tax=Mesorhizobium sp. SEMIA 3007 TaxID=1862350 RepID=UPI000B07197E|nr:hypothetical protein [Mesorhizobium sp. SEMIA 3007]
MIGGKPGKDSDEERFNETVQRMLKTPPKPHDSAHKQKSSSIFAKKMGTKLTKNK